MFSPQTVLLRDLTECVWSYLSYILLCKGISVLLLSKFEGTLMLQRLG
jgi:hypothetical protein